jgi:hypothetical protein
LGIAIYTAHIRCKDSINTYRLTIFNVGSKFYLRNPQALGIDRTRSQKKKQKNGAKAFFHEVIPPIYFSLSQFKQNLK